LLEAWSGVRTTQAASEAMGVALPRFYQLEARALQMIVAAMEPRPKGRQRTPESELSKLKAERGRLMRDVERYQSLYRTAQRSLGMAVVRPPDKAENPAPGGKRRRGPRKKARGQSVAAVLLDNNAPPSGAREVTNGATEQGLGPRGKAAGRPAEQAPRADDREHDRQGAVRG
jgi:hypothetical protein